ncbi:helix-turn-helix domain-containing protein [Spirillospora sp. NPDC050679]
MDLRRTAERFQASRTTAARWANRYRSHGPAGMVDRPIRPHYQPQCVTRPCRAGRFPLSSGF